MIDARTPTNYFQKRIPSSGVTSVSIQKKLGEIQERLIQLEQERPKTTAHKKIKENELRDFQSREYQEISRRIARNAISALIKGNDDTAIGAIKECLDFKAFARSEPNFRRVGTVIESQLFWD